MSEKMSRLWRLRRGVSPRTDPIAMPAATWPGVPSECRVLMIDWISLMRVSIQGK
jgi:hypothetical protein